MRGSCATSTCCRKSAGSPTSTACCTATPSGTSPEDTSTGADLRGEPPTVTASTSSSNALKFSPDGGSVSVSVSDGTRYAEIRVRDDGPGLPPEQLEKVFTPFHRAPGADAVPGVGLGLTIVRQIAERHGGLVRVESVLGAGATFVVRLPLRSNGRA